MRGHRNVVRFTYQQYPNGLPRKTTVGILMVRTDGM